MDVNYSNRLLFFLCVGLLIIGCSTTKTLSNKVNSTYEIKKFKSDRNSITINTFDKDAYNDKLNKALININGLYFNDTNFFRPRKGKYNIKVNFIGKQEVNVQNLVVKENDSIVINVYLADDSTPLHNY